jgi:hypothetical protein
LPSVLGQAPLSKQPTEREPYPSSARLDRAGRFITALVGRDVKRTFSDNGQILTGQSGKDTLEAHGQNLSQFRKSLFAIDHAVGR